MQNQNFWGFQYVPFLVETFQKKVSELLVGRSPTPAHGDAEDWVLLHATLGFVPLQEFCCPIRLQCSSVCLHKHSCGISRL